MTLWRLKRNILLSLPEELLAEIDTAARDAYMSRTTYIRTILQKEVGGKYPKALDEITKDNPTLFLNLDDL